MIVDNRWAINTVIWSCLEEILRIVLVISSSVMESKAEVASSKSNKCGFLNKALAIDKRCFSPPETLTPPSPIVVLMPFSARFNKFWQADFCKTSLISSSVASGLTKSKLSFIVPENNCASWVTKPNCCLSSVMSISLEFFSL